MACHATKSPDAFNTLGYNFVNEYSQILNMYHSMLHIEFQENSKIMHESRGCKYTGLEKDYSLKDLAAFHGHLGPYIVLGYRMGRYARLNFCNDPFQMNAEVHCSGMPPQSCLADGVQIGSVCTLGKRNIEIISDDEMWCEFRSGDRELVIKPKPIDFPERGDGNCDALIEELAARMYDLDDSKLFVAESSGPGEDP
jgi:formylmethanofuran dehydrogenase subunit E